MKGEKEIMIWLDVAMHNNITCYIGYTLLSHHLKYIHEWATMGHLLSFYQCCFVPCAVLVYSTLHWQCKTSSFSYDLFPTGHFIAITLLL